MFKKVITPKLVLRLTLGLMYLYSGIDIVRNPETWRWAIQELPGPLLSVIETIGVDFFFRIQGVGEIILALIFLAWFMPRGLVRICAFLAMVEMVLIVVLVGVDEKTFQSMGLIGASLALYILLRKRL